MLYCFLSNSWPFWEKNILLNEYFHAADETKFSLLNKVGEKRNKEQEKEQEYKLKQKRDNLQNRE